MEFKQFNTLKNFLMGSVDYINSSTRRQGLTGIASASLHNRIFYQCTTMITALADSLTEKGYSIDDADIGILKNELDNIMTLADMTPYALDSSFANYIAKADVITTTVDRNLLTTDFYKTIHLNSASVISATLPAPADVREGAWIKIKNINDGVGTISGGANTIDGETSIVLSKWDEVIIQRSGTKWYGKILSGGAQIDQSLTGNGYQMFESGLLMQWGVAPVTSAGIGTTGEASIVFPATDIGKKFIANPFSISVTQEQNGGAESGICAPYYRNVSASGMNIGLDFFDNTLRNVTRNVSWQAIGNWK